MEINHDRSYIRSEEKMFADRGYGYERIRYLRFNFVYTEAQKKANCEFAEKVGLSSPEWQASCDEAAKFKSAHMEAVMQAIGAKHWCYQYNKDRDMELFKSDDWDLFFWCNDFYNTTRGSLSGLDYSYFTLNFNDSQSAEKQREVYESVMQIISQFQDDENIEVDVQYEIALDEVKIKEAACKVAPSLVGKRTTYAPSGGVFSISCPEIEGRIVEANGSLYFMKKRAKRRGHLLDDKSILKIYWNMEAVDHKDNSPMKTITEKEYNALPADFKGVYHDYYGDHPEWKGRRTAAFPCELPGQFIEGVNLRIIQ